MKKVNDSPRLEPRSFECPDCERFNVQTEHILDTFRYGVGESAVEITCELPVRICIDCGLRFLDREAEEIKHAAVCRHLARLTPEEIRSTRERVGTQSEFSLLTGIGEASQSRWETGASIQSKAYDNYLFLLKYPENVQRLRARMVPMSGEHLNSTGARFRCIQPNESLLARKAAFRLRPEIAA